MSRRSRAFLLYAATMAGNNRTGNTNLVPFTSETASKAGKASAAKRRAAKLAADAQLMPGQRGDLAKATKTINEWIATYERDQLGEAAAAVAQHVMLEVLNGNIPLDARSAAPLMEAAVNITRLEAGLHTSATMHASVTMGDPMERIREIRAAAQRNVLEVGAAPDTTDAS